MITWCPVSNVTAVGVERFDIAQKIPTASIYLMFFIYGFMDPQLKRAFKRALRCYRFGNENTDHNCVRNRIETGLPGDTEMKVWTATITKKKQQYPGRKLIKRSECQRNIISGVLSSAGFRTVSMSTDCFKPSPAVFSKLDVHSVILKKSFTGN